MTNLASSTSTKTLEEFGKQLGAKDAEIAALKAKLLALEQAAVARQAAA